MAQVAEAVIINNKKKLKSLIHDSSYDILL